MLPLFCSQTTFDYQRLSQLGDIKHISYISGLSTMNHLRDGPPFSHPKICRTNNCALSPKCMSFCEASTLLKAQHHYRASSKKSLANPAPPPSCEQELEIVAKTSLGKVDRQEFELCKILNIMHLRRVRIVMWMKQCYKSSPSHRCSHHFDRW